MIESINLTHDNRIQLARKAEPFFLAYKKDDAFSGTFKNIKSAIPPKLVKRLEPEIWTLISATTQTIRYDSDACQLTMNKNNYTTANKITKKKISLDRMKQLIEILESQGFVTMYKGYYIKDSDARGVLKSMNSIIEFHDSWLQMFDVIRCRTQGTARNYEYVILKDKNGKLMSTKGLRGIGVEKALLGDWNKLLEQTHITIDGDKVTPLYTTVFNNGSLDLGGRLYAGSFSTEAHELRSTITINGNPTCEVDYKNNHFRILYNEYGVEYQQDAYAMECPDGWDSKELRLAAKFAGLMMLNAKSKTTAKKALLQKLNKCEYFNKAGEKVAKNSGDVDKVVPVFSNIPKTMETVNYVVSKLEEAHKVIADHFYKAEWDRLQNKDSLMAKQVVKSFTSRGTAVLTYHDSFVCESKYINLLIQTMQEAWEIVLGDSKGFDYDVEFDNSVVEDAEPAQEVFNHTIDTIPLEHYEDLSESYTGDCNVSDDYALYLSSEYCRESIHPPF